MLILLTMTFYNIHSNTCMHAYNNALAQARPQFTCFNCSLAEWGDIPHENTNPAI